MEINEDEKSSSTSSIAIEPRTVKNIQHLVDNLTEPQLKRYEAFRRAGFNKSGVRKFTQNILNQVPNNNFVICIAGAAKVFVGEIVEEALFVQKKRKALINQKNNTQNKNEDIRLSPSDVHEAFRRLYKKMPHLNVRNRNVFSNLK